MAEDKTKINNGRIAGVIPDLYYLRPNNLRKFIDALDVDVDLIEKKIAGLTDLINVDKCPDDKLVYLAALTGCKLIGNSPGFWRKQIKNWPHILKLKGTERSLELVLNSIGAAEWEIKTYFRDASGVYTTQKPEGKPFQDHKGDWYNVRTHYFGIGLTLSKEYVEAENYSWDVEEIKEKLSFWFNQGKPFHSELLNLSISSPEFLPKEHYCIWDNCTWEHLIERIYDWGMLTSDDTALTGEAVIKRLFEREVSSIHDTAFWNVNTWDNVPMYYTQGWQISETPLVASLEWGDGEFSTLYPNIWDNSLWDYASAFKRNFYIDKVHALLADFKHDKTPEPIGAIEHGCFVYDPAAKNWNELTWAEAVSWTGQPVQEDFIFKLEGEITGLKTGYWDYDSWDYLSEAAEYYETGSGILIKLFADDVTSSSGIITHNNFEVKSAPEVKFNLIQERLLSASLETERLAWDVSRWDYANKILAISKAGLDGQIYITANSEINDLAALDWQFKRAVILNPENNFAKNKVIWDVSRWDDAGEFISNSGFNNFNNLTASLELEDNSKIFRVASETKVFKAGYWDKDFWDSLSETAEVEDYEPDLNINLNIKALEDEVLSMSAMNFDRVLQAEHNAQAENNFAHERCIAACLEDENLISDVSSWDYSGKKMLFSFSLV